MSFLEGLAVATILAAPAVLVARAISRVPRRMENGTAGPDRDDISTWPGVGPLHPAPPPVTHYWPAVGSGRLDCCAGDPFTAGLSITSVRRQVTCAGMRRPASEREDGP